ncbi:MAG: nitroreductase family protein [Dehalococcoidales bacterium]|nr:nitroreductase family protein [Dehalococcoidales bacterium]
MEVFEAIKKRRSIRSYQPDPVPEAVLQKLLTSLQLAPSGHNYQPYKFIVVRDAVTRAKLAASCKYMTKRPSGQPFIAEAPLVIVGCGIERNTTVRFYKDGVNTLTVDHNVPSETDRRDPFFQDLMETDVAIALDHLTLTAVEEGLGTCWVFGLDEREVKDILSVPPDVRVLFVVSVGYPTSWPEPRPRKKLEDIICYEKYSQPE